jgi:hypothetical protein
MTTDWIIKLLDEPTVVWSPPPRDGTGGYSSWPNPVQLKGRWQFSVTSYGPKVSYGADGAVKPARTSVWLDHEIGVGSYLWKGSLSSLSSGATPETLSDAKQVIAVRNIRSIVTTDYLYKAFLDET